MHYLLASSVLGRWASRPWEASFPPGDQPAVNAFLAGCIAPDMGYFPGGDPLLSDLSHCVRTADLARNLLDGARTNEDRAFTLGWVTHVLADAWIHPLINRRAGEIAPGGSCESLSFAADPSLHMRIELGLDGSFLARGDLDRVPTPRPVYDAETIGFVAGTFARTYGVGIDPRVVLASHRASLRVTPWLIRLIRIASGGTAVSYALRRASGIFPQGGIPRNLLTLIAPPPWLMAEACEVLATFPERFQVCCESGLEDLPSYNLDTGRLESEEGSYPVTIQVVAALEGRGGRAS